MKGPAKRLRSRRTITAIQIALPQSKSTHSSACAPTGGDPIGSCFLHLQTACGVGAWLTDWKGQGHEAAHLWAPAHEATRRIPKDRLCEPWYHWSVSCNSTAAQTGNGAAREGAGDE
jgi:hypothetical protein